MLSYFVFADKEVLESHHKLCMLRIVDILDACRERILQKMQESSKEDTQEQERL